MQIPIGDTYNLKFTTRAFATGAPTTLAGTPDIAVYEEGSLTQITAGITLTTDFDGVTGLNNVAIVASGANGYAAGEYYSVVITTGTVDSVSVVGEVVGQFRVMAAEDSAGVPLARIESIANSAITAAAIASNAITAAKIAADAITAAKIAANAIGASELAADAVTEIQSGLATSASITALNDLSQADVRTAVGLASADLDTQIGALATSASISALNDISAAEVNAQVDSALLDYDGPTNAELTSAINGLNDLDAAGIRSAVGLASANLDTQISGVDGKIDDIQGAGFSSATDSLEAIRDRGDSDWTTGAGGNPPQLLQDTTIATLASQTSFTLTAGSADDDAYNGAIAVLTDQSTAVQKSFATISDYVGSTRTVTLAAPAAFTVAAGDQIEIMTPLGAAGSAPSAAAIRAEIDSNSTQLAAIVTDTGTTLPAQITALNDLSTADIDARLAAYDPPTNAELTAAIDGLNDLSAADIRTALGLTSANLDTQLAAIDTVVDSILADTGTDGVEISAATANQIADALLTRDWTAVSGEAARSALNALRFLRNRYSVSGTTLTVTEEDDTTAAWTSTLTTDANADPVTGSDPA